MALSELAPTLLSVASLTVAGPRNSNCFSTSDENWALSLPVQFLFLAV